MKKYFRKTLVYLIAMGIVLPTWLVSGLLAAPHAKAELVLLKPVFTEVYVSGDNDWAEVYNPNLADPIGLKGYSIEFSGPSGHQTFAVDDEVNLNPGEVKVLGKSDFSPELDLLSSNSVWWRTLKFPGTKQSDARYGSVSGNYPNSGKSLQFNQSLNVWFTADETPGQFDSKPVSISITRNPDADFYNGNYQLSADFSNVVDKYYGYFKDGVQAPWQMYDGPVTFTDEGDYIFIVYGQNALGQTSFGKSEFTIDKTAPIEGSININSGDQYTKDRSVDLSIDGADNSGYVDEMMLSEDPNFNGAIWQSAEQESVFELSDGDGSKTVYLKLKDRAGNISERYEDSIILDATAPVVSGVKDGDKTSKDVTVSFTDENTGVIATLDDASFESGAKVSTEGTHVLKVTDIAGNKTSVSFTIDRTGPVLTVTGDANTLVFKGGMITIPTATAKDAVDGDITTVDTTAPFTPPVIERTGSVDTSVLGDQTLSFKAVDYSGNESAAITRTFTVINPITFSANQNGSNSQISVAWTGVGKVDGYSIYVDGVLAKFIPTQKASGDDSGLAYTGEMNVDNFGSHKVIVKAKKGVAVSGNIDTASITLTAPVTVPVATVAPAPAKAAATTAAPEPSVTTPSDANGQIKGEETTAADDTNSDGSKVNWTPWIVLFILIILAGAATGGYFYWFNADEEEDEDIKTVVKKTAPIVKEVKKEEPKIELKEDKKPEVKPVAPKVQNNAKKNNNKKQKRW